jgi:hypothetical protein
VLAGQCQAVLEFRAVLLVAARLAEVEAAREMGKADQVGPVDPVAQVDPVEIMETVGDLGPAETAGKVRAGKGKVRGGQVVAADPEGPISTSLRIPHSLHPWLQARLPWFRSCNPQVVDVRRAVAKRADKEMAKVLAVKRAVVKQVVVNAVMGPAVTGQVVTGPAAAMAGDRVGLVAETVAWWVALPGGLESPVEVPGERLKSGRQPISSP